MNALSGQLAAPLRAEGLRPAGAPASIALDISCARGSVTVFTGPSAAESRQWLEVLAALRPARGRLWLLGADVRDPSELRRRIGYVDADAPLLSTFDVRMNVMLPRLYHCREPRVEAARIGERILDRIGYEGPRNEPPARLNKLERIQVLLARALVLDPLLLIVNEPFDIDIAADWNSLGQCVRALASDDDRAVLVATRNLAFASAHADQLVYTDSECVRVHESWRDFAMDTHSVRFIDQLPFAVTRS